MDIKFWCVYVFTVFLASIIPGPSMLLALTHGIRYGARRTIATALGNSTASLIQALISICGLGALLAASEPAFMIVKYAGAAYLIWLGIGMFAAGDFSVEALEERCRNNVSYRNMFLQGFWVAAGNPKAIVFFSALFPQFINSGHASVLHFSLMLGVLSIIAFACMMIYACGGHRARLLCSCSAVGRYAGRFLGTAFVGLGLGLACSRR